MSIRGITRYAGLGESLAPGCVYNERVKKTLGVALMRAGYRDSEGSLRLPHPGIALARPLVTVFDEPPHRRPCLPRSATHCARYERAAVEMLTESLGQVRTAKRTQVLSIAPLVGGEFLLPEVLAARGTLGHRVVKAVPVEQRTLFRAQIAGPTAVKMKYLAVLEGEAVVRSDQLEATRAFRLSVFHQRDGHPNSRPVQRGRQPVRS